MLLFMDGFDHYTNSANMGAKWNGPNSNAGGANPGAPGRFGGYSCAPGQTGWGSSPQKKLPSQVGTIFVGYAIYITSASQFYFGAIPGDTVSGGFQLYFRRESSGVITVLLGNASTVVATSTATLSLSTWHYLEYSVVFSTTTTGSLIVKLDGATIINVSGVKTCNTANAWADCISIVGSNSSNIYIDDLYVCDNTGAQNNTFLGESKIVTTYPSANGRLAQWATQVGGTGGQPWTAVNENNPDGDTSYIADNTAGDVHDFTVGSFGSITGVKGVQVNVDMRKDDVSAHTIGVGVGNGAAENFDAGTTVLSSYSMVNRTLDTNPLTSAAWTTGDLTTLQAAVKTIA